MNLDNSVVLITGGASGLGEAAAIALSSRGARVAILDIDRQRGTGLCKRLGSHAVFVESDVTSETQVCAAINEVKARFGSINACVNSAGIGAPQRTLTKEGPASLERFEKVLSVNVLGTFNVLRLAAGEMSRNDPSEDTGERGVIINTASIAAFDGQVGQASYSASKGAIVSMTLPVARDLASLGIRCVTIAPGVFETPILRGLSDEARASIGKDILFPRRLGAPPEYASLVSHIIQNPYINGTTIRLDAATRLSPR